MNDLSHSLTQRGCEFDRWNAHCCAIIRLELKCRKISVRHLFSEKVIKSRSGFAERLKADALRPRELSDLAEFLQIDLLHVMTAFEASEPDQGYTNPAYENLSAIHRALIKEIETQGTGPLLNMDLLRPAVVITLARRVLDLLTAHHRRCELAREELMPI
jgi:hypothetical protein